MSINGVTYHDAYDDEDRLLSVANPGGVTDTYTYNGLGLRVAKTDSTGSYSYVCDGTSAGSPVLSDGHAVYTPGLSDHRGSASTFSHPDFLGSLRFVTDSSQNVTANLLSDAFGATESASGSLLTPFGWNGGSGEQTEADTGIVLMGHRYYDSRVGRFLTQDPAGDGDNWYAYADNSPTNEVDPDGLMPMDGPGSSPMGSPGYMDGAASGSAGAFLDYSYSQGYWTNGAPLDHLLKDGKGNEYVANMYEGHTYWVPNMSGLTLAEELTLPLAPSGLPDGWQLDPSHRPPGGGRYRGPGGEGLDFQNGRPGKPGFEGQDHWHKLRLNDKGRWETDPSVGRRGGHLLPGDVVKWGAAGLVAYGLYEGVKWTAAILLAPETGGLSIGGAALVP